MLAPVDMLRLRTDLPHILSITYCSVPFTPFCNIARYVYLKDRSEVTRKEQEQFEKEEKWRQQQAAAQQSGGKRHRFQRGRKGRATEEEEEEEEEEEAADWEQQEPAGTGRRREGTDGGGAAAGTGSEQLATPVKGAGPSSSAPSLVVELQLPGDHLLRALKRESDEEELVAGRRRKDKGKAPAAEAGIVYDDNKVGGWGRQLRAVCDDKQGRLDAFARKPGGWVMRGCWRAAEEAVGGGHENKVGGRALCWLKVVGLMGCGLCIRMGPRRNLRNVA